MRIATLALALLLSGTNVQASEEDAAVKFDVVSWEYDKGYVPAGSENPTWGVRGKIRNTGRCTLKGGLFAKLLDENSEPVSQFRCYLNGNKPLPPGEVGLFEYYDSKARLGGGAGILLQVYLEVVTVPDNTSSVSSPPRSRRQSDSADESAGVHEEQPKSSPRQPDSDTLNVPTKKILSPPKLLSMKAPKYPRSARKKGIAGKVFVRFRIDVDGRVVEAKVLKGPEALHKAAIEAVRAYKFKPAMTDEGPTSVWMSQAVNFNLD